MSPYEFHEGDEVVIVRQYGDSNTVSRIAGTHQGRPLVANHSVSYHKDGTPRSASVTTHLVPALSYDSLKVARMELLKQVSKTARELDNGKVPEVNLQETMRHLCDASRAFRNHLDQNG